MHRFFLALALLVSGCVPDEPSTAHKLDMSQYDLQACPRQYIVAGICWTTGRCAEYKRCYPAEYAADRESARIINEGYQHDK